ncbi:MAG: histidine kinase [Chitinophagaceae bacterium]|nr:histidine kinase [Chitinophagaceae bacterium]
MISKLGFEDCVIYLVDKDRNILVQKAAWGPKTSSENMILNPIEIPVGQGIVGSVAQTGIAEIIPDTSLDQRYLVDDERRYSEITVPIMDGGNVLGIIDSEHRKKNFFKDRHLTILQTIGSLIGSKIVKAKAEAEKSAAELALINLKRKAAEVEMQALRAQMNPHFMFNSLNSINNFILNNDIDNASAYLTRFSRLMRLILDNSRQDWVPLSQELHALELYIGMESLRFDNAFTWHISIGEGVQADQVQIPPLLIQPYVENAIWHGLMHRNTTGGHLQVTLEKMDDWLLICIEDNGVGREAAARKKSMNTGHKKSHGMNITSERINMVNNVYHANVELEVKDKLTDTGQPLGTLVRLKMKYPV